MILNRARKISLIFCLFFLNVSAWGGSGYDPAGFPDLDYKDLTLSLRPVVTEENDIVDLKEYKLKDDHYVYSYKQETEDGTDVLTGEGSLHGVISVNDLKGNEVFRMDWVPPAVCDESFPPISMVILKTDNMFLSGPKGKKYILFCGSGGGHHVGFLFVYDIDQNQIVISLDLRYGFNFYKNKDGSYSIPVSGTDWAEINMGMDVYYPIYYQLRSMGSGVIGITRGTHDESVHFYKASINEMDKAYKDKIEADPTAMISEMMSIFLIASQIEDKKTYCSYLDKLEKIKLQNGPDDISFLNDELKSNLIKNYLNKLVKNSHIKCKGEH